MADIRLRPEKKAILSPHPCRANHRGGYFAGSVAQLEREFDPGEPQAPNGEPGVQASRMFRVHGTYDGRPHMLTVADRHRRQ